MVSMAESVSYASIADRYESVRGGAERADALAAAVDRWLPAGVVCDTGAGTGIVTQRLTRPDRRLVALDLSIEMLSQAAPRLPGRVAVADATRLPLASNSVDAVTYVWVLHHVGDVHAALVEAKRVLRTGGRVVAISGLSIPARDDMAPIFERLSDQLRPDRVRQARAVADVARAVGFTTAHDGIARTTADVSPNGLADAIEQRLFSHLWDLTDEQWSTLVDPAIDELRALPDPDTARERTFDHPLLVLDT